jgi:hypothetical protein
MPINRLFILSIQRGEYLLLNIHATRIKGYHQAQVRVLDGGGVE